MLAEGKTTFMIAIVFPGQGSQKPGMGEDFYLHDKHAKEVFDQIESATGVKVSTLCFSSDDETLRQTQNAQMALYACGLAAWYSLYHSFPEFKPGMMAGHSVGEYTALAAAGVISVEEGARLVQRRGDLMSQAGKQRPGTMAAVLAMDKESLEEVLKEVSDKGVAVVANDNSPGQLVISGDINAVQAASALASERGARRVIPLNVSGAFHSPLMQESADKMGERLRETEIEPGDYPVYSNVLAEPGSDWTILLKDQLLNPVRWTESVRNMIRDGATTFVECGSGDVLTNLLKRIDPDVKGLRVVDCPTKDDAVAQIKEAGL